MGAKGAKPFVPKHQNVFRCFQFRLPGSAVCFPELFLFFFFLSPVERLNFLRGDLEPSKERGWIHDFKYERRLHRCGCLEQLANSSGWFHKDQQHTSAKNTGRNIKAGRFMFVKQELRFWKWDGFVLKGLQKTAERREIHLKATPVSVHTGGKGPKISYRHLK